MPKKIVVKDAHIQIRQTRAFMAALKEEAEEQGFGSYAELVSMAIDSQFPRIRTRLAKNLKQEIK